MGNELFSEEAAPVPEVPFEDMLACVDRELKMRRKVYPHWVSQKKLTQGAADLEMRRMLGVRLRLVESQAILLALKRVDDVGNFTEALTFWRWVTTNQVTLLKQFPPA